MFFIDFDIELEDKLEAAKNSDKTKVVSSWIKSFSQHYYEYKNDVAQHMEGKVVDPAFDEKDIIVNLIESFLAKAKESLPTYEPIIVAKKKRTYNKRNSNKL